MKNIIFGTLQITVSSAAATWRYLEYLKILVQNNNAEIYPMLGKGFFMTLEQRFFEENL
jgi:hypothetical protein